MNSDTGSEWGIWWAWRWEWGCIERGIWQTNLTALWSYCTHQWRAYKPGQEKAHHSVYYWCACTRCRSEVRCAPLIRKKVIHYLHQSLRCSALRQSGICSHEGCWQHFWAHHFDRLIDERVEDVTCFQWQSQLRYYQNEKTKTCQVQFILLLQWSKAQ